MTINFIGKMTKDQQGLSSISFKGDFPLQSGMIPSYGDIVADSLTGETYVFKGSSNAKPLNPNIPIYQQPGWVKMGSGKSTCVRY